MVSVGNLYTNLGGYFELSFVMAESTETELPNSHAPCASLINFILKLNVLKLKVETGCWDCGRYEQ
jgi:hypothetical protein